MTSLPRQSANPYAASITSPSISGTSYLDRRPSTYSSYGFPTTSAPSGASNAYGSNPYSSSRRDSYNAGGRSFNLGRLVKRLFKFPQMDFEVAGWEMVNLMIAPRKVWRRVWYRKQTQNSYTTTDPAFPYLLAAFLLLTSLAWSLAYATPSFASAARVAFYFVFVHCLGFCLLLATISWYLIPRALGPRGWLVGFGEKIAPKRRGLFRDLDAQAQGAEGLEWGFAFDIAIRAFLPTWIYLYVVQFLLLPVIATHHWPSTLLANLIYAASFAQTTYITFLGYNSIPSLSATHLLLVPPLLAGAVLFLLCTISGWNASLYLAPVLWAGGGLRKAVGGV